jgi:hypothetical protein
MKLSLYSSLGLATAIALAALTQQQPALQLPRCTGAAIVRATHASVPSLARSGASEEEEAEYIVVLSAGPEMETGYEPVFVACCPPDLVTMEAELAVGVGVSNATEETGSDPY